MSCRCGGCGGTATADDVEVDVQPAVVATSEPRLNGNGTVDGGGCPGPLARLEGTADALFDLRIADAAGELSSGRFDGPIRCWPLWVWLAAIAWLGWVRSWVRS